MKPQTVGSGELIGILVEGWSEVVHLMAAARNSRNADLEEFIKGSLEAFKNRKSSSPHPALRGREETGLSSEFNLLLPPEHCASAILALVEFSNSDPAAFGESNINPEYARTMIAGYWAACPNEDDR